MIHKRTKTINISCRVGSNKNSKIFHKLGKNDGKNKIISINNWFGKNPSDFTV